jgi:hypothetical protein
VGDRVVNTNPGCKHHRSEGNVLGIEDLPDDMGKLVSYRVTNAGPTYRSGDVLRKTMDQVSPLYDDDPAYTDPHAHEPWSDHEVGGVWSDEEDFEAGFMSESTTTRNIMREWFHNRFDKVLKD